MAHREGCYHRCDRPRTWHTRPGKYGLFLVSRTDGRPLIPPRPDDMVSSADTVAALVSERQVFKPAARGVLAVIAKAVRIPAFEQEQSEREVH